MLNSAKIPNFLTLTKMYDNIILALAF